LLFWRCGSGGGIKVGEGTSEGRVQDDVRGLQRTKKGQDGEREWTCICVCAEEKLTSRKTAEKEKEAKKGRGFCLSSSSQLPPPLLLSFFPSLEKLTKLYILPTSLPKSPNSLRHDVGILGNENESSRISASRRLGRVARESSLGCNQGGLEDVLWISVRLY